MTAPGKAFENALMDALEAWVGDDGIPLLRKQSWSTRRGQFQMNQELDILVDSSDPDYYAGIEAKSRDASNSKNKYGFYASQIDVDQFREAREYGERSGRSVFVAVEARNWPGDDARAWLCPIETFIAPIEAGASKVTWEHIQEYGYCIGTDGDYEITDAAVTDVQAASDLIAAEGIDV